MMNLTSDLVKKLVFAAAHTDDEEIGCDRCFDELEKFAEMKLKGKTPDEAMPLIEAHLQKCGECREEFELLLKAMKTIQVPSA